MRRGGEVYREATYVVMAINSIIKAIGVRRIRGLQRTSGVGSTVIGKRYR